MKARNQKGFSLVEVIASVGILTVVMSGMCMAMSHAIDAQGYVIDDGLAINELRKGLSWLSSDMKKASATDLTDGGPPVYSVSATWMDQYQGSGLQHSVSYILKGDVLVRTYDGQAHTVGRNVRSASFYRVGKTIHAQLEVNAKKGSISALAIKAVMRSA